MSQTNAFAKANNPDYVYLDLQQTNVYNNSINDDVDINFIVTRDSPVIANTGDYTVSVTRFQIDTYKLPTLVVEPDLTGTFNPERTIHKIALLNSSAQIPVTTPTVETVLEQTLNALNEPQAGFGTTCDASETGDYLVVGAPNAYETISNTVSRGKVFLYKRNVSDGRYILFDIFNNLFDNIEDLEVGKSLSMSEDSKWIIIGTGGVVNSVTYMIERQSLTVIELPKLGLSLSNVGINHNGSLAVIGYPSLSQSGTERGRVQIIRRQGFVANVVQTINGTVNNKHIGFNVSMNASGSRIVIGSYSESNTNGIVMVYKNETPDETDNWTQEIVTIPAGIPDYLFGGSTHISYKGDILAVATSSATNTGRVIIYKYDHALSSYEFLEELPIPAGSIAYTGPSIGLSYDGSEVVLGYPESNSNSGRFIKYIYYEGSYIVLPPTEGTLANGKLGSSVATWNDGNDFIVGQSNAQNSDGNALVYHLTYNLYLPMPDYIKDHNTILNVYWSPASVNPSLIPPTRSSLTGKNTVLQPYYNCSSYARFIEKVNEALGYAYVTNFNYIHNNWITNLEDQQKNIFYNIVARFYSTPPFLEWSNSSLKASLVANVLFNQEATSYAINERTWVVQGGDATNNPDPSIPFHFKIAFNASLYALFNSFPATETVIENEKFYIIDFTAFVPNIITKMYNAIPLYPTYPFLDPFIGPDGIITLPSTVEYGHIDTHIVLEQELSTIDTWCPINGLVFTTNTLPIVINQFSANSSINGERPNPEAGADFALVITDLQTNQQGYKPNLIYTPTAEYRRVDMTGNLGLTNIDIRVFWRAKTGQLLPMKLGSGATASIKLLFQKKLLAERQQLQFQQFSVKDLKL